MKKCHVGPETIRMLELGHPWVLSDRYTKQWPVGESGELIALVDDKNHHLATALYDPKDRIVARVLDHNKIQLTVEWLEKKLLQAKLLRLHARLDETDAYRWLNSEGDGLPGVTIDRYGDYVMLQLYTSGWDIHLDLLTTAVQKVFQPKGIYRKLRPQETRALEAKRRTKEYSRLIAGKPAPVPLQVQENGLNFLVDLREGLNTGLFPDQRRNRQEFSARVAGKRVLNLFAFTGAFSVVAAASGAQKVTSVDVSAKYLDIARENFSINRINPKRHEFVVGDVFTELAKMQAQKRRFDVILFDPPSFSTTSKSRFSTHGGTSKLVSATMPLLESGGLLISSSNHQKVSMDDYMKELRRGALQSGDQLKTIFTSGQPEDFPCSVSFPEGRYLKFVISVKNQ
ncbi:class I SAM-dependent rRNA methyltransferase [uncultured Desulfuromusa sp.]|uniref:class I SAM-dependent rRNA methyltransferase n=1 Tax=uncultured Desulfuromusa sp. TaxID=219183 RepID=UPI002AA8F41A|nr:class I SAM-dependent rRNA methyltransferase [uncultured Desulfuromusa sp.]